MASPPPYPAPFTIQLALGYFSADKKRNQRPAVMNETRGQRIHSGADWRMENESAANQRQ